VAGGKLWHTLWDAEAHSRSGFEQIESDDTSSPGAFASVSCAAVGATLQVAGLANGHLWHAVRAADDGSRAKFRLIGSSQIDATKAGPFTSVSCAGVGFSQCELHVVGTAGGQLWHTIYDADDVSERPIFGLIRCVEGVQPSSFAQAACAGMGTALHVVAVGDRQLWHTSRDADGDWQRKFALIESQHVTPAHAFASVSCDGLHELQVVASESVT